MKGSEDLIWMFLAAFIAVVITTILIVVFMRPVSGMINEASKMQSKFLSYQIAGTISLQQSSDDYISTELNLPRSSVIVNITKYSVHVEFDKSNQYTYYFTEFKPFRTKILLADYISKNGEKVEYIEVSAEKYKSIIMEKVNDEIRIRANPRYPYLT
ncbi:MAG: hypothetical protein V1870_05105 [Candidatus Aenigmatarchaeota archaeon]